ncbi:MAG TPA: lipopolysaccharide biosynthesis protein [Dongiaceae bacterium]|nr:lipopolysaccharide biosynthesis protein [Dongiaceae bacterium]
MSDIRKAILFSVLNQHSLEIISIVSTAILARLLAPEEIGVFAVATSVAYLATELRSFGVGEYLIREKDINPAKIRTVLGVMVIMSLGLALILMGSAPWIADFYGNPELRNLLWIIALPFFLAPHTAVPYALLARDMQFSAIMRINLIGSLVRNGASIGLVMLGFSYYGLAYGTLASVVAEFLVITYLRPAGTPWMPTFSNMKHVFQIGVQISLAKFLMSTSKNASDMVLGRTSSMKDVGLFSRGLGLIQFLQSALIQAVSPVALPHLAQVKRAGGSVADAYLNAVMLVGAFALPLFAVVNLAAHPMINALFGDQWDISVHVASTMAFWAMMQSVHCFFTQSMLTMGKERLLMVKEMISLAAKVGLILATYHRGLEFVAWGFVIAGIIDLVVTTTMLKVALGLSVRALVKGVLHNLAVAAICWTTLKLVTLYVDLHHINPWLAILVVAVTMTPTWLIALRLTNNIAWPFVKGILQKLFSMVPWGNQPG